MSMRFVGMMSSGAASTVGNFNVSGVTTVRPSLLANAVQPACRNPTGGAVTPSVRKLFF
jgi:hypothetical protein